MSDYFDTQLREGSARVAGSLTTHTAADVRAHAKRRTRRLRAGTGALTAFAVLVVGGVVFGFEHRGGPATEAVGVTDTTTASATTPATSPAARSNSSAPAYSADSASALDPSRYVAAAWLSENHLPYATSIAWRPNPQALGSKLGGVVQLIPASGEFFAASVGNFDTYCSIDALTANAVADQEESFSGPITGSTVPSTPGIPANVTQRAVFYRDQNAAAAAWNAIGSGFEACAAFETGRVSGETKTYPSTGKSSRIRNELSVQCWTNLAAVSIGSAVTDTLDDTCFVQRGRLIGSVSLDFEGPSTLADLDFGDVDTTLISNLGQVLDAYSAG